LAVWKNLGAPFTPSITEITSSQDYVPEHAWMVLSYDSTLKTNISHPVPRGLNPQENYDFTVKQRTLAENAKIVHNLDELEKEVRNFQRYMSAILIKSYTVG
jgi:predicted proteasome-type protease